MSEKKNSDEQVLTRLEFKTELRSALVEFYDKLIEPRFDRLESEVREIKNEFKESRSETLGRFDDLYKKFEDLRQEYIFANEQMKRLAKSEEEFRKDLHLLKEKILLLQRQVEELEK